MADVALEMHNLSRRFGKVLAVDRLSLTVARGEVFGFLGPNGAGKTTTVRMLACLIAPSGGEAWVNGHKVGVDDMKIRREVGILTETPGLYERLSARLNLEIYAKLYGVKDVSGQVERYLRLLELWERRDEPAGTFSKGMRQKLALARALLHEPPVLFLDEPTAALDPAAAKTVRDFIETLKGEGRTIFLCTHNLAEAERLCDRIAVFRQRLIAVDAPDALRRQLFGRQVAVRLRTMSPVFEQVVRELDFVQALEVRNSEMHIRLTDPDTQNPLIVRCLVEAGAEIQYVAEVKHSLEDVYLSLVNGGSAPGEGLRGGTL
jgi:ABC-2 type transport system ATP-binding protein